MGQVGRILASTFVTGILIAGFVIVLPEETEAVKPGTPTIGSLDPSEDFTMSFQVKTLAGERIAFDDIQVLVDDNNVLSGNYLASPECTANAPTDVTLVSVTGADQSFGARTFTGYSVVTSGSGFAFGTGSNQDAGYGYGYGGDAEVVLTVTLKVKNCSFTYSSDKATVYVQASFGAGSALIYTLPSKVTFYNPASVGGTSSGDAEATTTTEVEKDGEEEKVETYIEPKDGANDSVAADTTITLNSTALGDTDSGLEEMELQTKKNLTRGSKLTVKTSSAATGSTLSSDNPLYNINKEKLKEKLGDNQPAMFITVNLTVPGDPTASADRYLTHLNVTINITDSTADADKFQLFAFNSTTGELKSTQPQKISGPVDTGANYTFVFKITDFSSFAFGQQATTTTPAKKSSGGGGGSPLINPDDLDGDGIPNDIELAAGTDPENADSMPDYDISDAITTTPTEDGILVQWEAPDGSSVLGYRLWRSDSPYTMIQELDATQTLYHDTDGQLTSLYKLTFFVQDSTIGGVSDDPTTIAGWDEGTYSTEAEAAQPEPEAPTAPQLTGLQPADYFGFGMAGMMLAVIIAVVVVVVRAGRD